MSQHLFVYGSLMTALAHPMGDRLRKEARLLGPGGIAGRLYRVSWYPGLREAEGPSDIVHGELYALTTASKTLDWLDEYEGINPGSSSAAAGDEYIRVERPIVLAGGLVVNAWVYLYNRDLPPSAFIADGIWRG